MVEMTSYERVLRMYQHREADRVPITDWIWELPRTLPTARGR